MTKSKEACKDRLNTLIETFSNSRNVRYNLTNRGFASEMNRLVSAVVLALNERMPLRLYSRKWNSAVLNGWTDYFRPFCIDERSPLFSLDSIPIVDKWDIESIRVMRTIATNDVLPDDVWRIIGSDEFFNTFFTIPPLQLSGEIFEAKAKVIRRIWQPNVWTDSFCRASSLKGLQREPFIGVHIRKGDKVCGETKEADSIPISEYASAILRIGEGVKNVFVATDDFRSLEDLKSFLPEMRIFSFCKPSSSGASQVRFNSGSRLKRYKMTLAIIRDIEMLRRSESFVCTYSSNIGRLVSLFVGRSKTISLDWPAWWPG